MKTHDVVIVGGGISGLSVAHYLKEGRPELEATVLEQQAEAGGKLRSSRHGGYTLDWGPNGFLSNVPETVELARSLGLEAELQPAADAAKHRLLYKDGSLRNLPTSPPAFLRSELLSPAAKLRAAAEVFAKAREEEETVHTFVARHFGEAFAETLAGPMVLGVTAGDARKVSLDALFPRLRELERQGGSLLRALVRAGREKRQRGEGRLTSFRGGVQRLSDALRERLGGSLQTEAGVTAILKSAKGYTVCLESGERLGASAVVLATPAFVSAALLASLVPEAAAELRRISYADVVVYGLGYHRIDVPRLLDGFGFLVPRGEGLRILGVLYASSLFPDQAPEDRVLLRVIAGGSLDPGFAALTEDEALEAVRRDLALSMGITAKPELAERVPWPRGIPQYELGHRARVARVMAALAGRSLFVTGNAYYGVGLNDCVRDARRVAGAVTESLKRLTPAIRHPATADHPSP
jgi:oxygen-dependent protoporphyrinogen oxidase